MDLISAIGLAKFVPDVIGLFSSKRGKGAAKAISVVGGIAEALTGKKGDAAVDAIASSPEMAYKFKVAVMANSHIQSQIELEDRKDARRMYAINPEQIDKVAANILSYNIPVVFLLVIINVLVVYYFKESAPLIAIISNFIGIVMHALLSERQALVSFCLGSSIGSKMKNKPTGQGE